jgi:hypothetical protein
LLNAPLENRPACADADASPTRTALLQLAILAFSPSSRNAVKMCGKQGVQFFLQLLKVE